MYNEMVLKQGGNLSYQEQTMGHGLAPYGSQDLRNLPITQTPGIYSGSSKRKAISKHLTTTGLENNLKNVR